MIPQDVIDGYLSGVFGQSEPGAALHRLLVATAPATSGPLGIPELAVTYYAIDASGDRDPEGFIAKTIMASVVEAFEKSAVVHFAGLTMEVDSVDTGPSEREQVDALLAEHRLRDHPAAIEVTRLYAACRDGRRWVGEHFLTGPRAGTVDGPHLRIGGLSPGEKGLHQNLIRRAVAIDPLPDRTRPNPTK